MKSTERPGSSVSLGNVGWRMWVADFAWLGHGFFVRSGILREFGEEKARRNAPFGGGVRSLCRGGERLYVSELRQERVLIVVAGA